MLFVSRNKRFHVEKCTWEQGYPKVGRRVMRKTNRRLLFLNLHCKDWMSLFIWQTYLVAALKVSALKWRSVFSSQSTSWSSHLTPSAGRVTRLFRMDHALLLVAVNRQTTTGNSLSLKSWSLRKRCQDYSH